MLRQLHIGDPIETFHTRLHPEDDKQLLVFEHSQAVRPYSYSDPIYIPGVTSLWSEIGPYNALPIVRSYLPINRYSINLNLTSSPTNLNINTCL